MDDGVLISIQPPWARMIMDGRKLYECRYSVTNSIKTGTKLFIYETKNNGGLGKIIGEAIVNDVWCLQFPIYVSRQYSENLQFEQIPKNIGFDYQRRLIEISSTHYYEEPIYLDNFIYLSNDKVKKPPQNMCNVIKIRKE